VIFSRNQFDFEKNFWLVYKNKTDKQPININYFEVCEIVKNSIPKNLVVYRLLTNVPQIDAYSSKYGYLVKIDSDLEIIYFDPVFALKDLNHLDIKMDLDKFRFKIQQLGLTSLTNQKNEPNFSMIFNFDLRAHEAQNQDDKVFVDAIFALDDNYSGNIKVLQNQEKELRKDKSIYIEPDFKEKAKDIFSLKSEIKEETIKSKREFSKINLEKNSDADIIRIQKTHMLRKALGLSEIQLNQSEIQNIDEEKNNLSASNSLSKKSAKKIQMIDLFRSSSKSSELFATRKNKSVILKLTNANSAE
jgi:hypothetical protein